MTYTLRVILTLAVFAISIHTNLAFAQDTGGATTKADPADPSNAFSDAINLLIVDYNLKSKEYLGPNIADGVKDPDLGLNADQKDTVGFMSINGVKKVEALIADKRYLDHLRQAFKQSLEDRGAAAPAKEGEKWQIPWAQAHRTKVLALFDALKDPNEKSKVELYARFAQDWTAKKYSDYELVLWTDAAWMALPERVRTFHGQGKTFQGRKLLEAWPSDPTTLVSQYACLFTEEGMYCGIITVANDAKIVIKHETGEIETTLGKVPGAHRIYVNPATGSTGSSGGTTAGLSDAAKQGLFPVDSKVKAKDGKSGVVAMHKGGKIMVSWDDGSPPGSFSDADIGTELFPVGGDGGGGTAAGSWAGHNVTINPLVGIKFGFGLADYPTNWNGRHPLAYLPGWKIFSLGYQYRQPGVVGLLIGGLVDVNYTQVMGGITETVYADRGFWNGARLNVGLQLQLGAHGRGPDTKAGHFEWSAFWSPQLEAMIGTNQQGFSFPLLLNGRGDIGWNILGKFTIGAYAELGARYWSTGAPTGLTWGNRPTKSTVKVWGAETSVGLQLRVPFGDIIDSL